MAGGRYSKIFRRMWNDEKFRALSQPKPCGQSLWMRLLCGPELGPVPGLIIAREPGLADALRWQLEPFRQSFTELSRLGMAEADWDAGLVWVPNAIMYNEPANPNVVKSWEDAWAELPECCLKNKAYLRLYDYMKGRGESFAEVFANHCRNHSENHCPNQDQDQEHKQEQEKPCEMVPEKRAFRPRNANDLELCLRVAIEREQPQAGRWIPGRFSTKDADKLLGDLGDVESALPEIERKIELFAKDPDMQPWSMAKFVDKYVSIGLPKLEFGRAPKQEQKPRCTPVRFT